MVHKIRVSMAPVAVAALATTMVVAAPRPLHGAQAAAPEHITYIYPYYTASPPRDLQAVQNAINALTTKKINTTVTLQPIAGGSYDQKMQLLFSAGQRCDAVFTAPWTNNFWLCASSGDAG